jgi:uncharacterized low-complexity protein
VRPTHPAASISVTAVVAAASSNFQVKGEDLIMSKHFSKKPLVLALSAVFAVGATAAQASVFQATDLGSGYMVALGGDAAKAGDAKAHEGKCGEGKCGEAMFKKMDANGDGNVSKEEFMKMHEGKCGEAKCGADKKKAEGKCGEGKCGDKKK